MRIESSNLLKSANKNITFANNCLIAKNGPNTEGKINLSPLNIKYDSFFSSNMTLQPQGVDTPIMYGFLGNSITFITIVASYNINPQICPDNLNYIEYFFEDQPTIRRTFTDIIMLSGNDEKRIPQMYVYNPGSNVINLNIMVGNLDVNTFSSLLNPTFTELVGLSFNCVISDQMYGLTTGSTQFEILDPLTISGGTGTTQLVIPYSNIDIIELSDNNTIIIKTRADIPIKLVFLTYFYTLQVYSKMNYVLENSYERHMTMTYPTFDVYSPVITFKPDPIISILPVMKSDLIMRYIDTIIDYDDFNSTNMRDGIINNEDVNILITNINTGENIEQIDVDGNYNITFMISDLAGNKTTVSKLLLIDSNAPNIIFNLNITDMDLTASTWTAGSIEDDDINRHYIDNIFDDVDGIIQNSAITITVTSGSTTIPTPITTIGDYDVMFTISDSFGNITSVTKQLKIVESSFPIIHYNSVFDNGVDFTMSLSSSTFDVASGITIEDIRFYALSSVTDTYDGNIDISNVLIIRDNIISEPILSIGNYIITFEIRDSSDNITRENKNLIVVL